MNHDQLIKKVHLLEIKARKLSQETFAGAYHASFKGQGLDFEDFREYQHGDEPRFIDWNVTARTNSPHVRTFKEERELNIILAVDISASVVFGSHHLSKRELAAELAAILTLTAKMNGDKVGLLLFSKQTELFLPPAKDTKHTLRIIRELLATKAKHKGTDIAQACTDLTQSIDKKSLIFLISDFMDKKFDKKIGILSKRHDLIALQISDPAESKLPDVGTITIADPETGEQRILATSDAKERANYQQAYQNHFLEVKQLFRRYAIDHSEFATDCDYLKPLHQLLTIRSKRHA